MSVDKSAERIRRMFGDIAGRYDLLNRLLSAGVDVSWRRRTVRMIEPPGEEGPILDVCTGTGDLALTYAKRYGPARPVVGVDFTHPMLVLAVQKARRRFGSEAERYVRFVEADAQRLPFPDETFQLVSVAFGLRNVSDTDCGLREMARVCRPGGKVVVLEFSMPRSFLLGAVYRFYFRRILPRVGQWLASNRDGAYEYLPQSVGSFPQHEELLERFRHAGLIQVAYRPLTFGIATLYWGEKPAMKPNSAPDAPSATRFAPSH